MGTSPVRGLLFEPGEAFFVYDWFHHSLTNRYELGDDQRHRTNARRYRSHLFDRLFGRSNPEPKQGKPTPGDDRSNVALDRDTILDVPSYRKSPLCA